jgi:hypothetical protein
MTASAPPKAFSNVTCLSTGALLFCTDNVTVTAEEDRRYRGLADPRARRGFEVGLDVAIRVLAEPMS